MFEIQGEGRGKRVAGSVQSTFILVINLISRLALAAYVLMHGSWYIGDTPHYLHFAEKVCTGQWGGEPGKGPLYLWYLCGLSPHIQYPELIAGTPPANVDVSPLVALPLLTQTLVLWALGVWLWKKYKRPGVVALWLFDPVLLAYSHLIMPDALFGGLVLCGCLLMDQLRQGPQKRAFWMLLGFCWAAVALCRPNGLMISMSAMALMGWWVLRRCSQSLKRPVVYSWVLALLTMILTLAPRLYWNQSRFNKMSLTIQGPTWFMSVAGVIENYGQGLDFPKSEQKWFQDHSRPTLNTAIDSVMAHPFRAFLLSAKGWIRVLVGHANVEWFVMARGEAPVGPGWTRPAEDRPGPRIAGADVFLWILGLALAAACALAGYILIFQRFKRRWDWLDAWALFCAATQTMMPLVYGEARFRLAVLPFILFMAARSQSK